MIAYSVGWFSATPYYPEISTCRMGPRSRRLTIQGLIIILYIIILYSRLCMYLYMVNHLENPVIYSHPA